MQAEINYKLILTLAATQEAARSFTSPGPIHPPVPASHRKLTYAHFA